MPVERKDPPVDRPARPARNSYADFFAALLATPSEWCSLPLEEIAGTTPMRKQTTVLTGAAKRGLKVQTTVQQGHLYARVVGDRPVTS
jgi:hypothetical protein